MASTVNLGPQGQSTGAVQQRQSPPPSGVAPQLSPNYLAELLVMRDGAEYIRLSTPLPENFSFSMESGYDRPLAQPASQLVGQSLNSMGMNNSATSVLQNPMAENIRTMTTGMTTQAKYLSAAVWSSGSVLSISLPFILYAQTDAAKEVAEIELKLLQLAAPGELGGFLQAPGPRIANAQAALDAVLGGATGGIVGDASRLNEVGDLGGDVITLYLGKMMEIGPCIIRSVNATHDAMFDEAGRPITAVVNVTVETYFTTTKEDLTKFFAPILGGVTP